LPKMNWMNALARFTVTIGLLFCGSLCFGQAATPTPAAKTPDKVNARPTPAPAAEPFDKADVKTMAAKCVRLYTAYGDIKIELYPESAPETVRNFLNLTAAGAFDTTTFSRVVPGFVVQGGNIWTRNGGVTSELGRRARRPVVDEPSHILHERGVLSMARSDEPNSATTHFFILLDKAPSLDGRFAAFGRVIEGMDVVDAINKMPVDGDKPVNPVKIIKAAVQPCGPVP
jgi:cyclophilin family peptidyl-prolyl cis-trans isomerase